MLVTLFFCSLSVRYLICSIALVPKVVIVSVLYFLVLHFVPFVAAILSVFVCKPRVSTCCHLRARKEVLVMSAVRTFLLYSKEASKLRGMWLWSWRNKPAGSQETKAELSKRRFVRGFVPLSCKTSTKNDRCFFIKERESVFCSQQQCRGVARIFQRGGHRQGHHPGIAHYIWFISLLSLVYQRA